jgi:hypothetical protein
MNVVVDDEREFPHLERLGKTVYLRTDAEAVAWLTDYVMTYVRQNGYVDEPVEELWLDHDLGSVGPPQDRRVIDTWGLVSLIRVFLMGCEADGAEPFSQIVIHSQNKVRASQMAKMLTCSKVFVRLQGQLPQDVRNIRREGSD